MPVPEKNSPVATITGLAIAGTGLAHFVRPALFDSITEQAFPRNSRRHLYINGGIETAIGLGLAAPQTRKLAVVGTLGYLAYLAGNVARNR
jgi:uncharacterized membrane protein